MNPIPLFLVAWLLGYALWLVAIRLISTRVEFRILLKTTLGFGCVVALQLALIVSILFR